MLAGKITKIDVLDSQSLLRKLNKRSVTIDDGSWRSVASVKGNLKEEGIKLGFFCDKAIMTDILIKDHADSSEKVERFYSLMCNNMYKTTTSKRQVVGGRYEWSRDE